MLLENNYLTGTIPRELGSTYEPEYGMEKRNFKLNNNMLSGVIPPSFENVEHVDVSENNMLASGHYLSFPEMWKTQNYDKPSKIAKSARK